ncbi:glycosyltransferase [Bacillus gobiensis]|uniref:glycosyltransferase n=1 Tax=Bacillus gobiensis TaxID=1441095 RepID=UPI003D1AAE5D
MKQTVLTFNGVYKPGFKGGGPVKSISNIAESLNNKINLFVIASDRDHGDESSYNGVRTDCWNNIDYEKVYYHRNIDVSILKLKKIIDELEYETAYLNGIFSNYTRKYLILKKIGIIKKKKVVLCPRGDFNEGKSNLVIKKIKKEIYIYITKLIGLYNDIQWHATSLEEKDNIKMRFKNASVKIAKNIPNKPMSLLDFKNIKKDPGKAHFIYISRINRKKNLKKSIELLTTLKGDIKFDIYGPIFEKNYWEECLKLIEKLPNNIDVEYKGILNNQLVENRLKEAQFMYMLTYGENYGHIIYEALSVGCPPIISDNTPWKGLIKLGAGWDLELDNDEKIIKVLQKCIDLNQEDYNNIRIKSLQYAEDYYNSDDSTKKTLEILS